MPWRCHWETGYTALRSIVLFHARRCCPGPSLPILKAMSRLRLTLLAVLTASLASCSRAPSGTVVLGAAGPIGSANGDANMSGFELALEELNARPGTNLKFDKVIL